MFDTTWIKNNWKDWITNYTTFSSASANWDWKRYITEGRKIWLPEEYFPKSTLENIKIPVLMADEYILIFLFAIIISQG